MLNDTLGAGILYSVTKGKRQFNVSQRKIMVLDDIFFSIGVKSQKNYVSLHQ